MRSLKERMFDKKIDKYCRIINTNLKERPAVGLLPSENFYELTADMLAAMHDKNPDWIVVHTDAVSTGDKVGLVVFVVIGLNVAAVWNVVTEGVKGLVNSATAKDINSELEKFDILRQTLEKEHGVQLEPIKV